MRNAAISLPLPLLVLIVPIVAGCTTYEYQLVRPPELSRHIGRNVDQVVQVEPLEYRLRTADNRLVMRVFNPTEDPIELIGPKCSVVDPGGQSHPLRSGTMAPGSFIKLIFPPLRPRTYDPYYGPTWHTGVGVGVRVDAHARRRAVPAQPPPPSAAARPVYLQVYDEGDTYYWDWKGGGEIRVLLVYRRGDTEFRHDFVFRRKKV
jgi:hypothetical protein